MRVAIDGVCLLYDSRIGYIETSTMDHAFLRRGRNSRVTRLTLASTCASLSSESLNVVLD